LIIYPRACIGYTYNNLLGTAVTVTVPRCYVTESDSDCSTIRP